MFRTRLLLMSLVAALSAVALLASSASAAIDFEWHVDGSALAAGEQRTFLISAESTFDVKGTVGGSIVLLLSNTLKATPGPRILGGKPGTGEEQLVFENVKVDRPANCEVESLPSPVAGTVKTDLLKTEIVEGRINHEPLLLFDPAEATPFAQLRFLGASCTLKNQEASITGSVLAEPLPHLSEVLTGLLDFEPSQGNQFILSTGGAFEEAGLTFGTNAATLGGKALMALTDTEVYGAF